MSDITVSSSSIINGPAEKVWKTLRAFGGIESFNPLVTSSELEGAVVSVGCKRVCYVSLDSGKNVLRTEEVLNSLDNQNRTMSYTVTSAPGTPFEGLVNAIIITSLPEENCEVRFTGTMTGKDELEIETKKKILYETYRKILNRLKHLHDRN